MVAVKKQHQLTHSNFILLPVRLLTKDYQRAGADVLQAFTFYATDGKLDTSESAKSYTVCFFCSNITFSKGAVNARTLEVRKHPCQFI